MPNTKRFISQYFVLCVLCILAFGIPSRALAQNEEVSSAKGDQLLLAPNLEINIPGLTFTTIPKTVSGTIEIPFLGQYISAIYNYLLGISVVAAAIMIVYGGLLYIIGSSVTSISSGKEKIADATIGLILMFSTFTILHFLNPAITQLRALQIPIIKTQIIEVSQDLLQKHQKRAAASGYTPDPAIKQLLKDNPGGTQPASRMFPNNPFDTRVSIESGQLDKILNTLSQTNGIDPCIVKAIVNTESGRKQNAVGHDEDSPHVEIQSRLDFLRSGIKFSKTAFTPPTDLPANCTQDVRSQCVVAVNSSASTQNDDTLTDTPPEYGLDWRFSHGFGIGQVTIFPPTGNKGCVGTDGGNGVKLGGKCFTVPILLTWEGQLEAMSLLIQRNGTPCAIFGAYGGLTKVDPDCTGAILSKKMAAYADCKGK